MRKYLPILFSVLILTVSAYIVMSKKKAQEASLATLRMADIGSFDRQKRCMVSPKFLKKQSIPQPVIIDLSQQRYKGIALLYGEKLQNVLHPKQWEKYEHLGTYTLDRKGNIYLAPIPFISISPHTFELQRNVYKVDTDTGELSIWMHFDEVHPDGHNPYGVVAIVYDCDDDSLWVSTIDESDYRHQRGVIYHIDTKTRKILQRSEGFDALSLQILHTNMGKLLLAGSAKDGGLYAFTVENGSLKTDTVKLLDMPASNERIRKIKIRGHNHLELQSIPFTYTLIAQTANDDRTHYDAYYDEKNHHWIIKKR